MRQDEYIKRSQLLYKFIVYQTKSLVSNNRGKPAYMDSFDHVIYDLYGIKHFSRKIAEYYDNRDIMDLIDRIGIKQLVQLMKNTRYCNIVRELTLIDNDTDSLEKEIRKMRRKGKSNKHMLREFNDLKKLYDKGIKSLRKRLGIRDARTAYKRRYMAVRDLVSGGRGYYDDDYDFEFSGLSNVRYRGGYDPYDNGRSYDDDYDVYDDRDYDEYDEDSSELEDFERMLNGPQKRQRRVNRPPVDDDFDDDDPYAKHEYDDDDLDEYEEYRRNRSVRNGNYDEKDRLDILTSHVVELSDAVQALMTQSRYDEVNHRDPVTHLPKRRYAQEYIPPQNNQDSGSMTQERFMATVIGEINGLKEATNHIIDTVYKMQEWQNEINSLLVEEAMEDGEFSEDAEVEMGAPIIDSEEDNYYQRIANAHPDVYSTPMEELPEDEEEIPPMPPRPKDPNHMTHKEVIEEVNRSQAQKANWSSDQKKEPQTTAREQKPVAKKEPEDNKSESDQKSEETK